jgi:hypothetical protein
MLNAARRQRKSLPWGVREQKCGNVKSEVADSLAPSCYSFFGAWPSET